MRILIVLLMLTLAGIGAHGDLLFDEESEERGSLIASSTKQFEEGDLITVLVQETIDASVESDTNTDKQANPNAEANANDNAFLVSENPNGMNILNPGELPNYDIDFENEHRATGQSTRANRLTMTITCVVKKVYENGNLELVGQKQVTVNREDSTMAVSGVVRSRDVTPANTVDSSQMFNANIELKGRGPLWNNDRRGLLSKILDWVSPF
jgi:flagellar L-ring protein precursor FlgH